MNYTTQNFNFTINQLLRFQDGLGKFQSTLTIFSDDYLTNKFGAIHYTMDVVLGFVLSASLINIVGIIASTILKIYKFKKMIHLSWAIFGFMYFGILILTYFYLPGGIIATEFCSYFNNILTNRT